MNLPQKILSLILLMTILVGIIAVAPVTIMATENPNILIENVTANLEEQIAVRIFLKNSHSIYGGNFTLEYDSDLLTAESFEYGSIVSDHTKNCNLDYQSAGNLVRFTFSGANALAADGTLVTITFKAKAEGDANLKFLACKMYNENGESVTIISNSSVITIEPTQIENDGVTLTIENTSVEVGGLVTVPVVISKASSVYGGNFTLEYDSNLLTAESFEYGSIVNDHTKNCNLDYQLAGNLVRFTFSGANALTADGTLVTITFKAKAEGDANLKFSACKMYDENGESVTASSNSSVVTIEPTSIKNEEVTLTIENTSVEVGGLVTVPVDIGKAASVYGGNFTLEYDSDLLTAESFEYGSIVSDHTKNCNLDYQSAGNLVRFTFSGANALAADGTLVTITFKAKAEGDANLKFLVCKTYDENGSAVEVSNSSGVVEIVGITDPVITGLLGDANEDSKVNIKDATAIQKHIANLVSLTKKGITLADTTQDTKVNIKDATAIQKHIAGIETGYPIGKYIT